MGKKYKTVHEGNMLRIIALKDFSNVKKGDWGGLIRSRFNLSQEGDCWVYDNAKIYGTARVSENAKVLGNAQVYSQARISGKAKVYGDAIVSDNAKISGCAKIYGGAYIHVNAEVFGKARVYEEAWVCDNARVYGSAQVYGKSLVVGKALISGNVKLHSPNKSYINTTSIKNSNDFMIFGNNRGKFFITCPDYIKTENIFLATTEMDYLKNIQTIRQIYGEKV